MSCFFTIFKSSLVLALTVGSLQIAVADDDDGDSWWGNRSRQSEGKQNDRFGNAAGNNTSNSGTYQRVSIGSPANCVACHQGAERGDFNEHSVRIPG